MFFRVLLKSLFQDYRSTLWTLLTLSGCATLIALFFMLHRDLERQISHTFEQMGASGTVYPTSPPSSQDWGRFEKICAQKKITRTRVEIRGGFVQKIPLPLARVDFQRIKKLTSYWSIQGRSPQRKEETLVGRKVARKIKASLSRKIQVQWQDDQKRTSELAVVGILDSGDEDEEKIFLSWAPPTLPLFQYGLVQGDSSSLKNLSEIFRRDGLPLEVRSLGQMVYGEREILSKISLLSLLTLMAVMILTALGVSSIAVARILERKREFALMQALGALKRDLILFLFWENILLGLVASLIGFGAGALLSKGISHQIFHFSLAPTWLALLVTTAITLGVAFGIGTLGIRRVLSFEPAKTLRGE